MSFLRAAPVRWLVVALAVVVLAVPLSPSRPAAAADHQLVIAALHVLDDEYVDPVQPVPLLNAAVGALRKVTNQSPAVLPDIPGGTSRADAEEAFAATFARAVQMSSVPETQLAYAATAGMLASLHDSHTNFLDPKQFQESRLQLQGQPGFTGVGVLISSRKDPAGDGWIFIEDVFPGSPAEAAGLKRFDRIVQVDGRPLRNATTQDASQAIRGPAGSVVTLTLLRGEQTLTIAVVRASIRPRTVEAKFIQPGIVYAKVFEFSRGVGSSLRGALLGLGLQEPIRSVILDLRGNPGGLIVEATSVGGIFLPPRTVLARITERGRQPSDLRTVGQPLLTAPQLAPTQPPLTAPQMAPTHPLQVYVGGRLVDLEVPPTVIRGRVLVPVRGVLEALGATVDYDARTQRITAVRGTHTIELTVGSRQAWINNAPRLLDVPASTLNGYTMIPLRFVSESLGADVQWIAASQTILIESPGTARPRFVSSLRIPLVVLVDGGSASASEILAGALKDLHRATVVGEKTAGALGGSVTVRLPEGAGMQVTVERITTPLGALVEGIGIPPDVPVALTINDILRGQDTQLEAALRAVGALGIERPARAA